MGRYSRKDMIEFANFAKSYQSPRGVEEAYEQYLKGRRIIAPRKNVSWYHLFLRSNKVFVDGFLVKCRESNQKIYGFNIAKAKCEVKSWDEDRRILHLTTIESNGGVRPLTEGKTKSNVKHYPNGIPAKSAPPPPPLP